MDKHDKRIIRRQPVRDFDRARKPTGLSACFKTKAFNQLQQSLRRLLSFDR